MIFLLKPWAVIFQEQLTLQHVFPIFISHFQLLSVILWVEQLYLSARLWMFISVFISYVCEIVVPGCNYRHNNKHEREADMMNTVSYRIASSHSYAKAETEWKDQDLSVPVP